MMLLRPTKPSARTRSTDAEYASSRASNVSWHTMRSCASVSRRRTGKTRQLVLAVAEFRIVLLDRNALRLEGGHDVVHHGRRRRHPDGGEAEALVQRRELAVGLLHGQGELALEGAAYAEPRRPAAGDLPPEEGPDRRPARSHPGRVVGDAAWPWQA
jgi:hypothetical protein